MDTITAIKTAESVANSQVVWAILCIAMTVYFIYSQKQDKKEWREERKETLEVQKSFSDALTSQANTMKEISDAVKETNNSVRNLKDRIDEIETKNYRSNNRVYEKERR